MKLVIEHLIYSNYNETGRHFRSASIDKNVYLEKEIEEYLGMLGEPFKLQNIEWAFCKLSNGLYLYVRFISKGRENYNNRLAQTYHCLLLSPLDFNSIKRFPFILNDKIEWFDIPPNQYKLNPLVVEIDFDKNINPFYNKLTKADTIFIIKFLLAIYNKHHIKFSPFNDYQKSIITACFCLPYFYRDELSFSTYSYSFNKSESPFLICIDHRMNSDANFYSELDRIDKSKLPFYNKLIPFLTTPNNESYNELFEWKPNILKYSSCSKYQFNSEEEKSITNFPNKISNRFLINIIVVLILMYLFTMINNYTHCLRIEEIPDMQFCPEIIYDSYINFSIKYKLLSRFTDCYKKIELYRKKSYEIGYINITKMSDCDLNKRLRMTKCYLNKFPNTPYKFELSNLIDKDEENIAWEELNEECSIMVLYYQYEKAIKCVEFFLQKYQTDEHSDDALNLKIKIHIEKEWHQITMGKNSSWDTFL